MRPLKVLHLFNEYLPQTENWSYRILRHTPDTQVFVGARAYLKNNFYHPDFTFADAVTSPGDYLSAAKSKHFFSSVLQKISLKTLQLLQEPPEKKLLAFAREHQVEVIHAHFADVAWFFRNIPLQLKKPLVISFYGWDYERLPFLQPAYQNHYQKLFKMAAAIICEGAHGAEIIKKMGCPPEKVKIVSLGVETAVIPSHPRIKRKDELHLLQLATFTEKKGHRYALEAFAKALEDCPNMTLTMRGGEAQASIKKNLQEWVKSKGLEAKVKIEGSIDYARIYEYLRDFQVFIHPSCYAADRDCEGGAPIVLLDAQATGMPVVSTRHCDIPGEVIHGKTGLLATEKNVKEIAEQLRIFYRMENEEYQLFSKNAREHVLRHFDSQSNSIRLKEIYDALG